MERDYPGATMKVGADRDTFATPLYEADKLSSELLSRLESLGDRLCGGRPETGGEGSRLQSMPSGLFEEIGGRAGSIRERISESLNHISRIERMLP